MMNYYSGIPIRWRYHSFRLRQYNHNIWYDSQIRQTMKHTQSIVEIFWRYCEESGLDLKLAAYISKSKPERLYQRNSLGNNTHPVLHELVFWLTSFLISITVRLPRDRLLFQSVRQGG